MMNFVFTISFRNLIRQRKRNILLGISMAFGVMILVVANSFSHGISDVMMNRVLRYVAGQVNVTFYERNLITCNVFRDKARLLEAVNKNSKGIIRVDESVGVVGRVIGNGKAENAMVVGLDTRKDVSGKLLREFKESFKIVDGSFESLRDSKAENPAVISTDWARDLNVKVGDVIRARYHDIYGQNQATHLTVTGIMKITNIFMSGVIFVELQNARTLCGYRDWEVGGLNLTLDHPKRDAVAIADRLHKVLTPGIAQIAGRLEFGCKSARVDCFGYFNDDTIKAKILKGAPIIASSGDDALGKKGVLVPQALANKLGATVGDKLHLSYQDKFGNKTTKHDLTVTAVIAPKEKAGDILLLNDYIFYPIYYDDLPLPPQAVPGAYIPQRSDALYQAFAPEWVLLPRTKTTDDFKKKLNQLTAKRSKAAVADVATMYEQASDILKFESALNLITLVAVLILFFIILVGVINTLRMTIRERTREIGTMRAIGMQQKDVRNAFILEIMLLTFFSSFAGIAMAFGVMWSVSRISLDITDNPLGMFLVDGHIYFLPTFIGVLFNVMLIVMIAFVTAYFPARRAARLKAADALRHYE